MPPYTNTYCDIRGLITDVYHLKSELCRLQRQLTDCCTPLPTDRTYFSTDFTDDINCVDTTLAGKRFRLAYSGIGDKMVIGVEWQYLSGGGFKIINDSVSSRLNGWTPAEGDIFHLEFY